MTDWRLIREVLNATIDACETLESLAVTETERGDPAVRQGDYEQGVAVGDFLCRFWQYPEGAQRDIIRLRSKFDTGDQKHYSELARALINTAQACAEIMGVPKEDMEREVDGFEPHCGSAGTSIKSQLTKIGWIYENWMVPGITEAVTTYRQKQTANEGA